ncbi:hypothetical protein B5M09_011037 [Aphanomyces astaci]|uniref:HTH CENPB-type domain-containing protein n=1 Tax=Aphanomyces astaci TaxID=112090 RepID=A0A425DEI1_APHAT|nr:hypothetical protein B5M09_011037 [Aphanomyces astaci]
MFMRLSPKTTSLAKSQQHAIPAGTWKGWRAKEAKILAQKQVRSSKVISAFTAYGVEVMPPGKTLAEVGKSSKVDKKNKHSKRISLVLTVRADGVKLPVLFVIKGQPGGLLEKKELPTYDSYASVLLVDNVDCHVFEASYDKTAEAMFSVIEPLPQNSTSRCQPLDVGVMGPFKAKLKTERLLEDTASERISSHDQWIEMCETKILSWVSWVLRCEELGVSVTGELIRKQAKSYYDEYQLVTNWALEFSEGWLYKFQRKRGLSSKRQHGEAGSTPRKQYGKDANKSWRQRVATTQVTRVPGLKKSKKRITLALTTNANGTDMVEPLFSGSAVQPRCFRGRSAADLGFDYTSNKKAWMNGDIFDTFLRKLDSRMEAASRNILLLVDNALPHKAKEDTLLTNVSLKMLPPNTTAYFQPQDAGIIASFKAKVKQRQLQNALEQIDSVMAGRQDRLYEVPLVEAMARAKDAWHAVSSTTIVNCWSRTGILHTDAPARSP